jgi:hypothetical protein
MTLVLDNPSQSGALILDDPTQVAAGGYIQPGVLGTVAVLGFAAALSISPGLQAQTGSVSVQSSQASLVADYVGQGQAASVGVQGRYAGFAAQSGGLLDGIADPDGDPLSLEIISTPPNGTFEWDVNGAFRFTPDPGWYGETQGQYRVWAGGEASNTETFTIHIDKQHDGVTGSVTVSGIAPALAIDFDVTGVTGLVSVQGLIPTAQPGTGYVAQAQTGSVGVQGASAALFGNFQGSVSTVSVQGQTPTIDQSETLQGVTGSVGVQSSAPSLTVSFDVQGVTGSVSVQSYSGVLDNNYIDVGVLGQVGVIGLSGSIASSNPVTINLTGLYSPSINLTGIYSPTKNLTGVWRQ